MSRPSGTFVIPMTHPKRFFRNQTNQFTATLDWERAIRIQKEGPTIVHQPIEEWQWRPAVEHLRTFMDAMLYSDPGPWSIDFEATVDRQVVCLGIWSCHEPTRRRGICIPYLSQGGVPYWNATELPTVHNLVTRFFEDPLRGKIGQNTVGYDTGYPPFNARSLIRTAWGINVRGLVGDTMVAHHLCFSELKHGLAFLSSVSTDLSPYKEELWDAEQEEDDDDEKDWTRILERSDEKVRKYNLKDAFAQACVWNAMEHEMGRAYVR